MIVLQRPGEVEFALTMPDYIIDTDVSINFSVQYKGQTILSEDYVPDANFQVRIRKLGKFCLNALWGKWADGNSFTQDTVSGVFGFLINGSKDTETFVVFSRIQTNTRALLSLINEKITRPWAPEWVSFLMKEGDELILAYTEDMIQWNTRTLYTHSGSLAVITLDVEFRYISSLIGDTTFLQYEIRHSGGEKMSFLIDRTSYLDSISFRFKNSFDVPETVMTVGILTLKGGDESETGTLFGVKRKFAVKPGDEYTANSGVIFQQSDYRLWRDFLNALEVEIQIGENWFPIVITKQNYEREFRRNRLKAVEFNFQMADPDQNGLIEL